ncbi:MAG: carbon monoxide dehydrogenase subunit G [Alphaproteobacteria bacterium]|nr:carbon monoxide dehydrogenase subunit G [Alphaproteobacteria bacterium]
MDMTGSYRISATRETVWAALNDVEVLKLCIPGCEEIERTSPTTMTAKVVQKIGPVKAKFDGAIKLLNIDAPASYTIKGEGQGGVAGFAKGGADVTLSEEEGETILEFTAKAQVGGKLARLGSRLIDATAKKVATKFFDNFHDHLTDKDPPGN